jgi:hypothetical protein
VELIHYIMGFIVRGLQKCNEIAAVRNCREGGRGRRLGRGFPSERDTWHHCRKGIFGANGYIRKVIVDAECDIWGKARPRFRLP